MIRKIKIPIIIIFLCLSSIIIYNKIQINSQSDPNKQISESEAINIVKNIPEVEEFMKDSDEYKIEATMDEKSKNWVIWVYYIKEGASNTFTFGYFEIDKDTGKVIELN